MEIDQRILSREVLGTQTNVKRDTEGAEGGGKIVGNLPSAPQIV
jgi:hypothetical protein